MEVKKQAKEIIKDYKRQIKNLKKTLKDMRREGRDLCEFESERGVKLIATSSELEAAVAELECARNGWVEFLAGGADTSTLRN